MKLLKYRVFEGINIYSFSPVIKLTVDLEDLAGVTTDQKEGFVEDLIRTVPSLREHHCSIGRPGGFIQRLQEGTYFGHLLEHLILELQHLAGLEAIYGKTRMVREPGVYDVIFEYKVVEAGLAAIRGAQQIICNLLDKKPVNVRNLVSSIKENALKYGLGPSTSAIAQEALKRDIPVMRLGGGSLLQLGYGSHQRRVEATITDSTTCIGVDIASDKPLAKQLLADAGIPVPEGGVAESEEEALAIARQIGGPVAIKPFNGNQGKGVALDLYTDAEIRKAFQLAASYGKKVVVERYITGKHYRLLLVDGNLSAASERLPALITADGAHTIQELIDRENLDPERGEGHEKPLTRIRVDPMVIMSLAKQGLELNSVPAKGTQILLRDNANISTGGKAVDVSDLVHPDNIKLAARAAKLVGVNVVGVDLVAHDISLPIQQYGGAIIEVNAAPGLRMHLYPHAGKPRNVAKDIVQSLFPPGAPSRIPLLAVTGTNGKTTTTRLLGHIFSKMNRVVGMTTSDGIYIKGQLIVRGDTTGPVSAKTVLRDPEVEIAVLETARGGIIRAGLGFDRCDVGVVTNISDDHLGVDGVADLEDLAYVKSLVAETAGRRGHAVLNADDKLVAGMANNCRGNLIYFSRKGNNILVRRHLGAGGKAVFVKNGTIVIAQGNKSSKVVAVKDIPCTLDGKAEHNVENVLAAVAGCWAVGASIQEIRSGLLTFQLGIICNPGRLNIFEVSGVKIIIDYGHNSAGYKCTLDTAAKLKSRRLIGVIGVPGDRLDEAIIKVGKIAGRCLDYAFLKEDSDLRGRKAGEVAELLKRGVLLGGLHPDHTAIALKETNAVLRALEMAEAGDTIVVFYEKFEPVMNIINTFKEVSKTKKQTENIGKLLKIRGKATV